MTQKEFEALKIKNGAFASIEYCSYPKPRAKFKDCIIKKVTRGVYRLGIAYKNLASKKDVETESLPYGEWVNTMVNKLIKHNDKHLLRIYMTNNRKHKPHTQWYINGEPTTKEALIEMGAISDSKSNHTELFNVYLENIIRIGKATE